MGGIRIYPDRQWIGALLIKNVFSNGADGLTMKPDARVAFHYPCAAAAPAMAKPRVGSGSDCGVAFVDAGGEPLDGAETCKVAQPPNASFDNFRAFTLHDAQTRSMLPSDRRPPTIDSIRNDPAANPDGAIDIFFRPESPAGREANWLQTIPAKSRFVILRMYGPLEPRFERSWKPSDVSRVQ